jgi:hypothetical protein
MLLLAENRRLRDQIAALKAELAITYGQAMNFDSPAPSARMVPTAAQRTQAAALLAVLPQMQEPHPSRSAVRVAGVTVCAPGGSAPR